MVSVWTKFATRNLLLFVVLSAGTYSVEGSFETNIGKGEGTGDRFPEGQLEDPLPDELARLGTGLIAYSLSTAR
jgi:hypothetical protein